MSLQRVESPLDVLMAQHPEVAHEQVSRLSDGLVRRLVQFGEVKQVFCDLPRRRDKTCVKCQEHAHARTHTPQSLVLQGPAGC